MVRLRTAAPLLAFLLVATPAWAQNTTVRPQVTPQTVRPQLTTPNQVTAEQLQERLRNRPSAQPFPALSGAFTAPTFNALITSRKLNALRALGLNLPSSSLGAPLYLAPLRHTIDSSTYMTFAGEIAPALALPPATTMSGAVSLAWGTFVELNFRATSPFQYHLVECTFEGASLREVLFDYYVREGSTFPVLAWSSFRAVPVANGRAAVLLEPSPNLERRVSFIGNTSDMSRHYFGGCEITPVSP
jgi:hypothetical protein